MPSKGEKRVRAPKKDNESSTPSSFGDLPFSVYRFIHEPNRLQMMAHLYALEEVDMLYLKKSLGISWSNLSFHTTKLEEMGYISINKQFIGKKPYTLLRITPKGKARFEDYRRVMRDFLK